MAQENIKLTLPQTGLECELLPYVKHKLSKKINNTLFAGKTIEIDIDQEDAGNGAQAAEKKANQLANKTISVELTNMTITAELKVKGLLEKLGDKTRAEITDEDIDDLPQKDFNILIDAANKVFENAEKKSDPKKS